MGIFDFIKSAGQALGIGEEPTSEELQKQIDDLGLADGVKVEVNGDKATISGEVEDKSIWEKLVVAVGNTIGIGSVEAAGADDLQPVFHTVEKGDTLSAIALKTLGDANKYNIIFEANKPMLTHPDKIYPGQVLRIPQDG
jgi:nucleoid-associated protein YgaU